MFVRTYHNLDAFWPYIKREAGSYAERREIISLAFTPLLDHLGGASAMPGDKGTSEVLGSFDSAGVHVLWFGIFTVIVVEMAQITPKHVHFSRSLTPYLASAPLPTGFAPRRFVFTEGLNVRTEDCGLSVCLHVCRLSLEVGSLLSGLLTVQPNTSSHFVMGKPAPS